MSFTKHRKKKLKGEPGPVLEALVSWSNERWLRDHLLLDGPDAMIPPGLSKGPLHFLGRTGGGLFGVERASTVFPIDARPIFFAPFAAKEGVQVAENLREFLLEHPSLDDARPELTGRVEATAASTPVTGPELAKPAPKSSAKKPSAKRPSTKKPVKKPVTKLDLQIAASEALRELGPAVGLVFSIEGVATDSSRKRATITLCVQMPRTTELDEVAAHPLSQDVASEVNASAERFGYTGEVDFVLEPAAADPIAHLIPIVRRCAAHEPVVAFLESFRV